MAARITLFQMFMDTYANLAEQVPYEGEPFFVTDTQQRGVGDGESTVAELLATGADYASGDISSTGTTTITPPICAREYDVLAQLGNGAGAYTRKLVLDTAGRVARDKVRFRIELPAHANPTVEIRNATAGGALLLTQPGDAENAVNLIVTCTLRGGAWVILNVQTSNL